MTCKEYNDDIRRIEPEKAKEKLDMPKWIYHLEESISRVRREINQMSLLNAKLRNNSPLTKNAC